MPTFYEFLTRISGRNNPLRSIPNYSLNTTYRNRMYQEILEQNFGTAGTCVSSIADNEVLSHGARVLFLKIAILATHDECYKFLSCIYARITKEHQGYYWELLRAIKTINDHCNDTPIQHHAAHYSYFDTKPSKLIFNNIGTDQVPAAAISSAIKSLIKQKINELAAFGRIKLGNDGYVESQISTAKMLDTMQPDPSWMMAITSITRDQIIAAANEPQHRAWHDRMHLRHEKIKQQFNRAKLELQGLNLDQTQLQQALEQVEIQIIISTNTTEDEQLERAETARITADYHRYNEELRILKEVTAIQQRSNKPRPAS
jgi:hypothetical protein